METAKETLHKVVNPDSHQAQQASNLERDMEPKPTKAHLGNEEEGYSLYKPSGKLAGKTALITGGDSGIGRSVAMLFGMEGATLAIVYLAAEEEDAQHTKAQVEKNGGKIVLIPTDLSEASNCHAVVDKVKHDFGKLDILVNAAAHRSDQAGIADIDEAQWTLTMNTNVNALFHLTKYALPIMAQGGVIINSTSVDAYIGSPTRLDYATSAGAIVAFTRALSNSLMRDGIRVNAVAPGPVWTPLMATNVSKTDKHLGDSSPMGRLGQPVEVATSYVFLASSDSQFMTGQVLHPNGGIVVNG